MREILLWRSCGDRCVFALRSWGGWGVVAERQVRHIRALSMGGLQTVLGFQTAGAAYTCTCSGVAWLEYARIAQCVGRGMVVNQIG